MKRSLAWMDPMGAKTKSVQVAAGNWNALEPYCRYGFTPRFAVMEQRPKVRSILRLRLKIPR